MGLTRKANTHHHQNKPLQRTKKILWKRINQSMMAMSESAVPTSAPIYLTIPQNVNQQSDRDRIEKLFPKKTMTVCSILQLICAGLAALTQVVLFVVDPSRYSSIADVGAGIWTGVFFGFAGGVGLIASQRPSHCSVIAFMVMSIISSLFAIPLIVISGIGLGTSGYGLSTHENLMVLLFCVQLLTALFQGIVAVTTAAFSCRVVCCGKRSSNGTVVFSNVVPSQSERVAVPLTVIAGATAAPTTSLNVNNEKPPKYEDGDEYQRFE